jgi:hypothetical protein
MRADERYMLREISSEALAFASRMEAAARDSRYFARCVDELLVADHKRNQAAAMRSKRWKWFRRS